MGTDLGKVAYEAYCLVVGGKSVHGENLPSYENQSETIREAWCQAAAAVATHLQVEV